MRWVDRLGRDYQDVSDSIRHFMRDGVVIKTVINGRGEPLASTISSIILGLFWTGARQRASPGG